MSLIEDFLDGSQRVTARVIYYIPLQKDQKPLTISPELIGQAPKEIHHTNILQTFVHQFDDKTDFEDKRLKQVFADLVLANKGIVKIHNRFERVSAMLDDIGQSGPKVPPLLIPHPSEEANPGMQDEVRVFKTLVPFPRVRSFLQHWQEKLDGPMLMVQLATQPINQSSVRLVALERTIN